MIPLCQLSTHSCHKPCWVAFPCLRKGRDDMGTPCRCHPSTLPFRSTTLPPRAVSTAGCSAARKAAAPIIGSISTSTATRSSRISRRMRSGARATNPVDGEEVPVPHFGAVLPMQEWKELAERLVEGGVEFVIPPTVRFAGQPGEQATMFLLRSRRQRAGIQGDGRPGQIVRQRTRRPALSPARAAGRAVCGAGRHRRLRAASRSDG